MLNTYERATAANPRTPTPVHDGTPADVYVCGMCCSRMLRGVDNEIKQAAKKNAMYCASPRNACFSMGTWGEYDGGTGEFVG